MIAQSLPLFSAAGASPVLPTSAPHGAESAPGGARANFANRHAPRRGRPRSPLGLQVLDALRRLGPSTEREVWAAVGANDHAEREAVRNQLRQAVVREDAAALRSATGRLRYECLVEPEAPAPPPSGTRRRLPMAPEPLPCGGAYAGRGGSCEATTCRYHVAGVGELFPSWCALDVAEATGGVLPWVVAEITGYSRQRIQQIEAVALRKIAKRAPELAALLGAVGGAEGWTW